MRPPDQDTLARELRQQLIPSRKSRRRVDVEDHRDLGMLQLDALCVDGVSPKQDFLPLRREFITSVAWSVTRQRNELHAVHDRLGATKRVPLAVKINKEAVAYPVRLMAYHHVVQDVVGGTPICATY